MRNRIAEIQKREESQALGDINEWKKIIEDNRKSKNGKLKEIRSCEEKIDEFQTKRVLPRAKPKNSEKNNIPKPRSTRSLQILFTNREFPTPCRESLLEEETEYLRKQAEARRSSGSLFLRKIHHLKYLYYY